MATTHRTMTDKITRRAVPPGKPRSPYDDLLNGVAQGQPMGVA